MKQNLDFPSNKFKKQILYHKKASTAIHGFFGAFGNFFEIIISKTRHLKFFAFIKLIVYIFTHSFSLLKKNFFNFGLELVLVTAVGGSLVFNLVLAQDNYSPSENVFLSYLTEHEELNELFLEKIKTEKIQVTPQKEYRLFVDRAAALDPLINLGTTQLVDSSTAAKEEAQSPVLLTSDSVLVKPNFTTKDAVQKKDIQEYTVQTGDSVGKIASDFGVSVQTILYENKLGDTDYIRPGQVLKILPTTGLKHEVKSGETLLAIAKKYGVEVEAILEFNQIEIPDDIFPGEVLIIPEGKIQITPTRQTQIAELNRVDIKQANLPDDFVASSGTFLWPLPTRYVTQYYWSKHRAIDVSNGKRPQFWAAQSGVVELSGWQGGYGNTIVINHGNGMKTRYAHASELYVTAGDQVEKGQIIGRVGNTGRSYGITGNHLHFEIVKNGTKVDPMKYLQ